MSGGRERITDHHSTSPSVTHKHTITNMAPFLILGNSGTGRTLSTSQTLFPSLCLTLSIPEDLPCRLCLARLFTTPHRNPSQFTNKS
jgi:hypothetical protein